MRFCPINVSVKGLIEDSGHQYLHVRFLHRFMYHLPHKSIVTIKYSCLMKLNEHNLH